MKVLVCDDEENIRNLLKRYFALFSIDCLVAENGLSAKRMISQEAFDAVLVDLKMPGIDGLELIKWLRSEGFSMPIVMISAHGEISDAVEALKEGADDYLEKPFDPEEMVRRVKLLTEARNLDVTQNSNDGALGSLIGSSTAMERIKDVISRISKTMATILITGESGTGKEVVARAIHKASELSGPFVPINIGGVPENLLESELFGYEKGAFTGATARKIGLFELAGGGTLFLDEMGDMPLSLQVKILRVLQEKKITRLGGTEEIAINARIIAATNKNLEDMVRKGKFREDLFYRLNVVRIELPPLRERKEDIPLLSAYIAKKLAKRMDKRIEGFTPEAMEALKAHEFYGNVRELENILERALIFSDGPTIGKNDLLFSQSVSKDMQGSKDDLIPDEVYSLKEIEKYAIIKALQRWEGNRTKAAEELGISRRTLITKIAEYGIEL